MAEKQAVVVLCGLPGAGKTTLAKRLIAHWRSCRHFQVIHVEFDQVERQVLAANPEDSQWTSDGWREGRAKAIAMVEASLKGEIQNSAKAKVLIVDDNMYYRSMRARIRKIAADLNAGFVQVYLQMTPSEAMEANAKRPTEERVAGEVIQRMFSKLEPPGPDEPHSLIITSQPDYRLLHCESNEMVERDICESITLVLEKALEHPEISGAMVEAEKLRRAEASREEAQQNLVHQTDLALCKRVSEYIKALPSAERREASQRISMIKKRFTANLRERVHAAMTQLQPSTSPHNNAKLSGSSSFENDRLALVVEKLCVEFQDLLDKS